jgi:ferredoxin--NADP+ reductase
MTGETVCQDTSQAFRIVKLKAAAPNIYEMIIEAPIIARKVEPGQFVILIPDETGERVPFTISDWDTEKGTITIFFQETGVSTMKMACMQEGDELVSVVGPLGKPTEIDKYGTVFLGGGCYGIGGIFPIARAMKEAGNRVIISIEARSKYLLYNLENLESVAGELIMSTSDGSTEYKGKVHNTIQMLLDRGEKIDRAHFMGCNFMLMISSEATKPHNIPTRVALNALMVDGTGMCGCCRCTVEGKTKYACVDGPEFDGHQVDWDELFARGAHYVGDESIAYQFYGQRSCKMDMDD